MSGFEIAGVVLGGLPLLIAAIEHYDDIVSPFKRWRKFVPELELFRLQLDLERTTFRNDCHILLETLTDRQTARRALDRSLRTDATLNAKYASRLGDSLDLCDDTIRVIREKLRVIGKEGDKFGHVATEPIPNDPGVQIAFRLRAKQKLKFAFSKPHLEEILADLRIFTQAFTKLCSQIQRLDANTIKHISDRVATKPNKRFQDCQQIQRASRQLYSALCKACSTHENHSAHFKLEPRHVHLDENDVPLIRFNIAYAQPRTADQLSSSDPTWLAIESVLGIAEQPTTASLSSSGLLSSSVSSVSVTEPTSSIHRLGKSLKRACDPPTNVGSERLKIQKTVSFAATMVQPSSQATAQSSRSVDSALPDFCLRQDLCICVQRYSQYTLENPDRHIGYLQKTGPCKNLVYFSSPMGYCRPAQPLSLAEVVVQMSQQKRAGYTMPLERVRLAKQLASAVLQFHDTPLLKRTWRSQDVVFFGNTVNATSQRQTLASPHLDVLIQGAKAVAAATTSTDFNELLVRNLYLFNLGVVLLEIAYQKPFAVLRDESGVTNVADGILRDFLVAKQLSEDVSAQLGSEYGDVVKKCLHCDFNTASGDLNDQVLQAAVYKEVVIKLEDLEIGIVSNVART